mmetsp:Transcript_75424/g.208116  ORF Transcript_75424/g.208116 Transcript_75424/m.208116 type:complete len:124 (+) Transcript_75424:4252-4623(+)
MARRSAVEVQRFATGACSSAAEDRSLAAASARRWVAAPAYRLVAAVVQHLAAVVAHRSVAAARHLAAVAAHLWEGAARCLVAAGQSAALALSCRRPLPCQVEARWVAWARSQHQPRVATHSVS